MPKALTRKRAWLVPWGVGPNWWAEERERVRKGKADGKQNTADSGL